MDKTTIKKNGGHQITTGDGNGSEKIILFQSINNVQIMLPELGFVNALRAYFELHRIDYLIDQRSNVEYMSPDGQLPLIKYGNRLVSGYGPIIEFINQERNIDQSNTSSDDVSNMSLLLERVTSAELYYTWLDKDIYETFTIVNYSYGKPWPLNNILCWMKRREIASRIEDKNVRKMINDLEEIFKVLSDELKQKKSSPTTSPMNEDNFFVDNIRCFVYGHIKAILSFGKPYDSLYNIVQNYPTLISFVEQFENNLHSL